MPIINVPELGPIEIAGTEPTPEEREAIRRTIEAEKEKPAPPSAVSEVVPGVIRGVRNAAQNLLNLSVNRPAGALHERFPIGTLEIKNSHLNFNAKGPFQPIMLPAMKEAETTAGQVVTGISQFLIPYLGALRVIGLGQSALSTFARLEGAAILTEQVVFDPFDQRLSDLVEQFPQLSNPVTEFLASDPDDSEAEARFKLAAESTGLGILAGALAPAVKGLNFLKRGQTEKALKEIEKARAAIPAIADAPPPKAFLGVDAGIREMALNVNLKNIDSSDEIKGVLAVTADSFEGSIDEARRGTIRDEQIRQLAIDTNLTVDELLSRQKGETFNAETILAARTMMVQSGGNLLDAAKKAAGSGNEADLLAYEKALQLHLGIQEQVSGLAAEAGRALRQFQIPAGADIEEFLSQMGGRKTLREQATLLSQFDDVGQLTALAKEFDKPTLTDKALEVWINGLLSGPQTHAVNALSNTMTSLWSIPEHFLAAGIGLIRGTPERETFTEVFSRVVGWGQGARDGFKLASRAFITEQPSDVFSKLDIRHQAIGGPAGQFVRLPGRALVASDEFFKSIGYRMELNALATKSAMDAGLSPRTRAFAEHVQGIIKSPPEDISLKAIDNARYLTFTKPLEGVSRFILRAERELPALRLVMPFVRTPTNIVRFAGERTPFGLFMRETRNATGPELDRQLAKLTLGSMAGYSIVSMAAEGRVTGSGPSDPVARNILRDSGWQPYSFVFDNPDATKRYLAYNRVEPLGIIFGLAADFHQIAGEATEGEREKLGAMMSAAVAQNLTDKTFFKGLSDLISAVDDPERFADAYLRNLAGTAVPTGLAQAARVRDPILRDARDVTQRIMSRIPGYSEDLPARLNLWGEPIVLSGGLGPDIISPIYSSYSRNDPATNELIRLELFPGMPQRILEGEEIPQDEYWKFVRNSGRLAHEQIVTLVGTDQWRNLDRFPETQRSILREIIRENRSVARAVLRRRLGRVLSRREEEMLREFGVDPESIREAVAQ